uniref:Uncharacterized protein MANES_18G012100 n=1 Tax=Rhizophora mucronata TaxID=61149 RepID=A0A2P2JG27_RHIMU
MTEPLSILQPSINKPKSI